MAFEDGVPARREDARWLGEALAQTLWIIRRDIGRGKVESAAIGALVQTQASRRAARYESIYARRVVDLLGADGSQARAEFSQHEILSH